MGKNILITGSSSFLGNSLVSNDKENIYFTFGNRGSKNFNVQPRDFKSLICNIILEK